MAKYKIPNGFNVRVAGAILGFRNRLFIIGRWPAFKAHSIERACCSHPFPDALNPNEVFY